MTIDSRVEKPAYRYRSPMNRYGSPEMHHIWSDENRGLRNRDVWIAQATVQAGIGLATKEELADLIAHRDEIDIDVIDSRELNPDDPRYSGHDIVAAISQYADVAPIGARVLHQADTSEDLLSNVEIMLIDDAYSVVEKRLVAALSAFGPRIDELKDVACMGYTHLQAAEPITMGYRLARYAQDLVFDLKFTRFVHENLRSKGIKGPVGTSGSFDHLLAGTGMTPREHERQVIALLGAPEPALIAGQTYPRKTTLGTLINLGFIAQSTYSFGNDVKLLQSSPFSEVSEPRRANDSSSSSMMHKRNPRHVENIKSLSRSIAGKMVEAWMGAADVTLERGLEDSAGKRSYLPEAFLAIDEVLMRTERVAKGLVIREVGLRRNLNQFGPFTALELVLAEISKRGGHRQEADKLLRVHAGKSIEAVESGEHNPLLSLVSADPYINTYLSPDETEELFESVPKHIGDASERCTEFLETQLYPAIAK